MSACNYCKHYVIDKENLSVHESKHVQRENNVFTCTICSAAFDQIAEIIKHHEDNHPVANFYKCAFCTRLFESVKHLVAHSRNHSTYKIMKIKKGTKCPQCQIKFATKPLLKLHLKGHAKQFQCIHCESMFDAIGLAKQRHKCPKKKPIWQCRYCQQVFKNQYRKFKHVQKEHTDIVNREHFQKYSKFCKMNIPKNV